VNPLARAAVPRPAAQLPDPGHLWIRYRPRAWPGPPRPWTDLAAAGLGGVGRPSRGPLPELAEPLDDVVVLPPVRAEQSGERAELAARLAAAGTPVLVQTLPGEAEVPAGAVAVYDLLEPLLSGDLDRLAALPRGAVAVWPLIAGLTDEARLWRLGCERLAAAGASVLQALALDLGAGDRRQLASRVGGRGYDQLFHAPAPAERDLARVAHQHGLRPFLDRPLAGPPLGPAANRRLGGVLGLVAELWLRVGRPVGRGQAYYRAMRWLDRSPYDLPVLAREGNLGVLTWLDADSRRLVEEVLATGGSRLLAELLAEYVGGEAP
jgi:hypothetical protein